jgi:hypothetical protein
MSLLPFLSGGRLYEIETDDPDVKRQIGLYWGDAVAHFLATGDTSRLEPYRRRRLGGLPFETDPDVIEDFYMGTDFDFQEFYEP